MADPVQMRAKEKRLAEALRANLKRRKDQARERNDVSSEGGAVPGMDVVIRSPSSTQEKDG